MDQVTKKLEKIPEDCVEIFSLLELMRIGDHPAFHDTSFGNGLVRSVGGAIEDFLH